MREAEAMAAGHGADLSLIASAAREAGNIAMRYFRKEPEVWWKEGDSPVSEADYAVNRFLLDTLCAARPDYGWLSEETADSAARLSARRTFVVDPIDGTRAFIANRGTWCVSVAIVEDGRPIAGVLDCPAKREIFDAVLGGGVRLNGDPIHVRKAGGQLSVGGPKAMIAQLPEQLRANVHAHGHVPSLAYRVAMVAQGVLDATFVKAHSHDWDLAAADLILEEAGGRVVDGAGTPPSYAGSQTRLGPLAAGSGALLREMTSVIAANAEKRR